MTLNPYTYAGCDPTNSTDPSGRSHDYYDYSGDDFGCGLAVGGMALAVAGVGFSIFSGGTSLALVSYGVGAVGAMDACYDFERW